ncbi:Zinc-finger of the MIZ type in Nse subunit [Teratosphaeria destructans]|uniref:Zinc-finger of the MIZ type in Nse subunit n=1 Tax=Teratosphaeria destructans TaxID=418781 RepID=A0A9W7SIH8_9PEZI|nr:Zinc-finger of the MIZ type in Nse subunit [Teratosphaeria destructans]
MSRVRQSTASATPASSSRYGPARGRGATATPAPGTIGRTNSGQGRLPDYEPPQFSLNPKGQRDLAALLQDPKLKQLDKHFNEAVEYVSTAATEINDRLRDTEIRLQARKRSRQDAEGDDVEGGDDIEQTLNQLREKVDKMTERMDESMRKIIDGQQGIAAIKRSIIQTAESAREHASTQASTQHMRSQTRPRRSSGSNEASDDEEYPEIQPTDPTTGTQALQSAVEVFKQTLDDSKTRYQSNSLYDRYATNEHYVNFRKLVHDARTGDDDAPMPDPEDWFPEGNVPAPGITHRGPVGGGGEEDSDDDIAVARVQISTKCPITLQQFKNPVTSKKCNHSFEKSAILELLSRGQRVRNDRCVQCPVGACKEMLTEHDLHFDPVLIRKIKRIQRAKELEEQEEEDEEDESGIRHSGTQRNATLIDSGDEEDDGSTQIGRSTLVNTDNEYKLYE